MVGTETTTDEVAFVVASNDVREVAEVVPTVNGVALTDLIDRFEEASGMEPRGYGGLVQSFFRVGSMDRHYLNEASDMFGSSDRVPLLGCECGDWGCWPLLARVTVSAHEVRWDEFQQPHRERRDYSGFGPFVFIRQQYEDALRELVSQLDEQPDSP